MLTGDADERCRNRPEDELAEALKGRRGTGHVRIISQRECVCRREDQPDSAHHHQQRCDQRAQR